MFISFVKYSYSKNFYNVLFFKQAFTRNQLNIFNSDSPAYFFISLLNQTTLMGKQNRANVDVGNNDETLMVRFNYPCLV
jgi:hypothetical protein